MQQNAVPTLAQLPENRSARIAALRPLRRQCVEGCASWVSLPGTAHYLPAPRVGRCICRINLVRGTGHRPAAERCRAHRGAAMKDAGSAVALTGNPNVGKSTVFSRAPTGGRQHTGNWSGKTEPALAEGRITGEDITLIDLPGTYSLHARSQEEALACEFLILPAVRRLSFLSQMLPASSAVLFWSCRCSRRSRTPFSA